MAGIVDPKALSGASHGLIRLNRGLDLSTGLMFAPQGSLRDAINVELVDGVLEASLGLITSGGLARNKVATDFYILDGDAATDFTLAGASLPWADGDEIRWYEENVTSSVRAGSGIVTYDTYSGQTVFGIEHIEGKPPTDYTFFNNPGNTKNLTINPAAVSTHYFRRPSLPETGLTAEYYLGAEIGLNQPTLTPSYTWDAFRPNPIGGVHRLGSGSEATDGPVSHVFQHNDYLYAVKDFPVLTVDDITEIPSIGDKIQINSTSGTDPIFYVARCQVYTGDALSGTAEAWVYVYPASDSTLDATDWDDWTNGDAVNNLTTGNPMGVIRTTSINYPEKGAHGLLWKLDTSGRLNTGWSYVDSGYSVKFQSGSVAPVVERGAIFVTDHEPSIRDTGSFAPGFDAQFPSTGTFSTWAGTGNTLTDNATYASSTIAATDFTNVFRVTLNPSPNLPDGAKITGLEVSFEAYASAASSVKPCRVRFVNSINPLARNSENRADDANDYVDIAAEVYSYGGALDLWGYEELSVDEVNGNYLDLELQFENVNAASRDIFVDYIFVTIHYTTTAETVYFYNGTSDVATGAVHAYQVMDGEWSTDDASGYFSLSSLTNPSSIPYGTQIRTGASGTGTLLATTVAVEKNILPSWYEMEYEQARCQSYVSSIGGNLNQSMVFVTNGVSPCFALDSDDRFQFIRLPVDRHLDHPRYVSEIRNHLMLSVGEHVMISSVASPNNFSTYDGATAWNVGGEVTGLVKAPDGTVLIICRDSLNTMYGSGASGQDAFQVKPHNSSGGGRHYSGSWLGDAMFVNNYGLSTFSATDKFGNFDADAMNYGVEDWLRQRLSAETNGDQIGERSFLEMIPIRAKNQLRMYFNDGWVLVASFPPVGSESTQPHFTWQQYSFIPFTTVVGSAWYHTDNSYAPTCISSEVSSWGEERVYIGTRSGYVHRIEHGTWVNTGYMYATFATNPIGGSNPLVDTLKVFGVALGFDRDFDQPIAMTHAVDYAAPPYISSGSFIGANAISAAKTRAGAHYKGEYIPDIGTYTHGELTNGVSWRVLTYTQWQTPPRFYALSPRMSLKGQAKARTQSAVSVAAT